jgi:hypothetical protein
MWRKSIDSPVWKNQNLWRFWSWCLLKATHRETAEMVGYQCVQLQPGEFVFGRHKAAQETGLSEQTIRTCLLHLEKLGNLTIKTTNKFSILTIEKWEDYQSSDQQPTSKSTSSQPAGNQHLTTNKHISTKEQKKEEETPPESCSKPAGSNGSQPTKKYSGSFEAFWKAYPGPRKGSKWKAYKSWQAIGKNKLVTVTEIMAALSAQVEADHFIGERGDDFTPNAVTWLNGRRWEDEIACDRGQELASWDELMEEDTRQ